MKKLYFILSAIILTFNINAQLTVKLNINHKLLSQNFAFNQTSTNNLGHSFNLNRMQYYLSSFVIIHDGAQTTTATGVYNLVDASTITSINLGTYTNITNIEGIKFSVGVNTPENNQDPALWPSNHALSPKSPSMHWGWASGYFFIALGGNSSPSLNQQLELHALGNTNYYSQTITTGATLNATELIITINADYAQALKNINISSGLILHGSSGSNAVMATNFRDFVFTPLSTVGINENSLSTNGIVVYPNPSSTGLFAISADNYPKNSTTLKITNVTGRVMDVKKLNELNNNEISIDTKGIYFISLLNNDVLITTQKVIVY
jgi:hypothetical protein